MTSDGLRRATWSSFEPGLRQAGLLPNRPDATWPPDGRADTNLLPLLQHAWRNAESSSASRAGRRLEWLDRCLASGASLTRCDAAPESESGLGTRLIFWPRGVTGRCVGLVSSRFRRRLADRHAWLTLLRSACERCGPADILVTAARTTTAPFVERAARRLDRRLLWVTAAEANEPADWRAWGKKLLNCATDAADDFAAWFSPSVPAAFNAQPEAPARRQGNDPRASAGACGWALNDSCVSVPARDRAVEWLAERLFVMQVRRGGGLERLVTRRLAEPSREPGSTFVALDPELVPRELSAEWCGRGAVGWIVRETNASPAPAPMPSTAVFPAWPDAEPWDYLSHWTRAPATGWPDDPAAWLDDLLLNRLADPPTARTALERILVSGRLVATSRTIRGGTPVVSLTAVPLARLAERRVFRVHRSQWDFEPYGLCLARRWLADRGARPVIYGDEDDWQRLAADDRPFFQRRFTRGRRTGRTIDWSVEEEWRWLGDLDLTQVPSDAALVFVPSREDAARLQPLSRWPIVVRDNQSEA